MDIPIDDVVLLKSAPTTLSPNSLRENWVSRGIPHLMLVVAKLMYQFNAVKIHFIVNFG